MDTFDQLSSLLMIIWSICGMIFGVIFLLIVASNHECQTLTILLVGNSTIAGLIANIACICQAFYQLFQLDYDRLCPIRGLLLQSGTGLLYHTLCVQAFHRLFVTVYATRRVFQTQRFNIAMVVCQWLFSATFGLPILFTGQIVYHRGSRICQGSMDDPFVFVYFALIIFWIPIITISSIYVHIVKYMKQTPFSTLNRSSMATQQRQRSELRLIRRILILVISLFVLGFPYFFFFLAIRFQWIPSWPYVLRISYLFITFGQSASMLINLITTDPVRKLFVTFLSRISCRQDRVEHLET